VIIVYDLQSKPIIWSIKEAKTFWFYTLASFIKNYLREVVLDSCNLMEDEAAVNITLASFTFLGKHSAISSFLSSSSLLAF